MQEPHRPDSAQFHLLLVGWRQPVQGPVSISVKWGQQYLPLEAKSKQSVKGKTCRIAAHSTAAGGQSQAGLRTPESQLCHLLGTRP